MARVTVEDCLDNFENRFDLVLGAAKRARELANGADSLLGWEGDKPTVMALREAAAGHLTPDILSKVEEPKPLFATAKPVFKSEDKDTDDLE